MRKLFIALGFAFTLGFVQAQTAEVPKEKWYHAGIEQTGIYGVNTDQALDFLKQHKRKANTIIVGVLDSGVENFHEDLKANMWKNPKEIPGNGIDDDKNGYIDDVYGWSFLGTAKGISYNDDTTEVTRVYKHLAEKYDTYDQKKNQLAISNNPSEYAEFQRVQKDYLTAVGKAKYNQQVGQARLNAIEGGINKMVLEFGDTKLSKDILKNYQPTDSQILESLWIFGELKEEQWIGKTMQEVANFYLASARRAAKGDALTSHLNLNLVDRKDVDNPNDKTERFYGNNDSNGPESTHGTHVAGIIGAVRGNNIGSEGTAGGNNVKIMSVRTVPNGDERDKDVANAIRYAVDNGAKILNMSFGKTFSPDKELVWDAFKYASDKGVLIVKAAGNSNENIDIDVHYPTNFKNNQPVSKSVLTVGASTKDPNALKARFSNYGKKSVDVFGPGQEIYATYPGVDQYRFLNGTSMASPAVAGVAALVWSHYPKLTAEDIRSILMETVNKNDQLKDISVSGGVVDSYKAVQKAEEIYKQRKLK
ncbi:S8 family serine peptidase [Chishuiella sp.]|uniref:S8 family serine peptidase n=1 Tax=Chishuiella sp. TaxID=1969467 RepID=UPI0028A67830|nr:S8 family serine peptidase [Chishuiella sp.]